MKTNPLYLAVVLLLLPAFNLNAQTPSDEIDSLKEPLYNPFVERYILDEIKSLRVDLAAQRHEIMQQILDREHQSVDRGVICAVGLSFS